MTSITYGEEKFASKCFSEFICLLQRDKCTLALNCCLLYTDSQKRNNWHNLQPSWTGTRYHDSVVIVFEAFHHTRHVGKAIGWMFQADKECKKRILRKCIFLDRELFACLKILSLLRPKAARKKIGAGLRVPASFRFSAQMDTGH